MFHYFFSNCIKLQPDNLELHWISLNNLFMRYHPLSTCPSTKCVFTRSFTSLDAFLLSFLKVKKVFRRQVLVYLVASKAYFFFLVGQTWIFLLNVFYPSIIIKFFSVLMKTFWLFIKKKSKQLIHSFPFFKEVHPLHLFSFPWLSNYLHTCFST